MQRRLRICYSTFQTLMLRDDGQDLIEYAMLVGLIAFAATAGMQAAAGGVNTVFTRVAAIISNATALIETGNSQSSSATYPRGLTDLT